MRSRKDFNVRADEKAMRERRKWAEYGPCTWEGCKAMAKMPCRDTGIIGRGKVLGNAHSGRPKMEVL